VSSPDPGRQHRQAAPTERPWFVRALGAAALLAAGGAASVALLLLFVFAIIYSNLPPIDALTDYRPKIPLRVWTADGVLIGEFGEERRDFLPFSEIPEAMKKAILAAEDDGFYQHSGVDYMGLLRAAVSNFVSGRRGQGGSTITMQVARNFFLSSERSYVRKIYEIALAYKIESSLSKDRIFEVYANQIFLGQRAYGFSAASQVYFGKKAKDLTVAEMATLAGLPVAPSAYNPFVNPKRAKARQQYVLSRMLQLGYIDKATHDAAVAQELKPRQTTLENAEGPRLRVHAEYAAELARQLVFEVFHNETYTRGLNVTTTLRKDDQEVAYAALRKQVLDYDRKYGYRGPEAFIELGDDPGIREQRMPSSRRSKARTCCLRWCWKWRRAASASSSRVAGPSRSRAKASSSSRRPFPRRRSRTARSCRARWCVWRAPTRACGRSPSCLRWRRRSSPPAPRMARFALSSAVSTST
jgi:penicillin-binding protein 1A